MEIPKRETTLRKYIDIQARKKFLYEEKRLRLDDVIAMIQKEFYISHEDTVYKILALDLSKVSNKKSPVSN